VFIIFRILIARENTFAILSKIDRSKLVCFIRTSSREEKLLLETYDENGKRVTDREAGRQAGRQSYGEECRWLSRHDETRSASVGTFPGDNDPLVLSARVRSSSGFRSPVRSAFLYLMSPFRHFSNHRMTTIILYSRFIV